MVILLLKSIINMKKTLIILPILVMIIYLVSVGYALSNPVVNTEENNLVLLENKFDTVLFNKETNCAEWVKWKITVDRKAKENVKRKNYPFTADDTKLLTSKVTPDDYTGQGYDRGHLNPAADNEHSRVAMKDCMEMTNIIPQTPQLNRGPWKTLEESCRKWSKNYGTTIYVVAGPVYSDSAEVNLIGVKRKILVPDKCFKAVLIGNFKAFGYIMENSRNPVKDIQKCKVSVDSIENLTGYDFFEWLPDSLENELEK